MSSLLHQLRQAQLNTDGCLLCWLEHYQVTRYLEGVANDGVNNIPLRQKLMRRGGYCPSHSEMFVKQAHVLSAAILLEDFLKLHHNNAKKGGRATKIDCEACEVISTTQRTLIQSIKKQRQSAELHRVLLDSKLCLGHLEAVCQHLPENIRLQLVAKHDALMENLAELIRKHDYRFTDELRTPEEKKSVLAALKLMNNSP